MFKKKTKNMTAGTIAFMLKYIHLYKSFFILLFAVFAARFCF